MSNQLKDVSCSDLGQVLGLDDPPAGRYWWRVRCRAPHLMYGVARGLGAEEDPGGAAAGRAVDAARSRCGLADVTRHTIDLGHAF